MNEIRGDEYTITYDPITATVTCQGTFRQYGMTGYESIEHMLEQVAEQKAPVITIDLKKLEFLNSSGINAFSKFIITVRNYAVSRIVIFGNPDISWQIRSLENLQRLMPNIQVRFE